MPDMNISEDNPGGFPEGFLASLGQRFRFDPSDAGLRQELAYIARRYQRDVRAFDISANCNSETRKYRALREEVEDLRAALASPDFEALSSEIYLTLRTTWPEKDEVVIRPAAVPSALVGDHILRGLDDLLKLVSQTASNVETRNAPPKGRKPDYALECLVRNIAYLWKDILGQPFRLDYHKGSVLTEAAEFVITVAGFVAPDVTQTRLITTMRTIIREQNLVLPIK